MGQSVPRRGRGAEERGKGHSPAVLGCPGLRSGCASGSTGGRAPGWSAVDVLCGNAISTGRFPRVILYGTQRRRARP